MSEGPGAPRADGDFADRHRLVLVLLWAQMPALILFGAVSGASVPRTLLGGLVPAAFALGAMYLRTRRLAAAATALGMVAAAGLVIVYSDGSVVAYVVFFAAITAVSWYRMMAPLTVGVTAAALAALILPTGQAQVAPMVVPTALVAVAALLAVGWRLDPTPPGEGASGDMFRLGFERAPIGMAVLKPSGDFLEVNTALADMLGYEPEALIGTNLGRLIHGDDMADLGEAWEEMANSESQRASQWMRLVTATGRQIWGRFSLSLVPRRLGQPAMVIVQVEDATNSYEEQSRLEGLLRGKDEFVAAVGDELKEPLQLLIDLTDLADHLHVAPAETIPRIEAHAREIASILDDLVVSARADTTPVSVVAQRLDSAQLCRDVLAAFGESDAIDRELRPLDLWADPALTRQILRSLLGNAVRYGGPSVTVETMTSGPDTVIQVSDNGPEIPLTERERIFSGDLRSGQPVTRPAAVGLSLTVGRHLARQMDGDIEYHRIDGCNVFELRLPSERLSEAPPPPMRPAEATA